MKYGLRFRGHFLTGDTRKVSLIISMAVSQNTVVEQFIEIGSILKAKFNHANRISETAIVAKFTECQKIPLRSAPRRKRRNFSRGYSENYVSQEHETLRKNCW